MNKISTREFIDTIAKQTDTSESITSRVVKAVFAEIKNQTINGNEVWIRDFGTFSTIKRKAHKCMNPSTKKIMKVPAKRYPSFRASGSFKEAVAATKKK